MVWRRRTMRRGPPAVAAGTGFTRISAHEPPGTSGEPAYTRTHERHLRVLRAKDAFFRRDEGGRGGAVRGARGRVRPRRALPLPARPGSLLSDRLFRAGRGRRSRRGPPDVYALRPAEGPRERDVGRPPGWTRGRGARLRRRRGSSDRRIAEAPARPSPARP